MRWTPSAGVDDEGRVPRTWSASQLQSRACSCPARGAEAFPDVGVVASTSSPVDGGKRAQAMACQRDLARAEARQSPWPGRGRRVRLRARNPAGAGRRGNRQARSRACIPAPAQAGRRCRGALPASCRPRRRRAFARAAPAGSRSAEPRGPSGALGCIPSRGRPLRNERRARVSQRSGAQHRASVTAVVRRDERVDFVEVVRPEPGRGGRRGAEHVWISHLSNPRKRACSVSG